MSLEYIDGFEGYSSSELAARWTLGTSGAGIAIDASGGRRGTAALELAGGNSLHNVTRSLTVNMNRIVVGFAYKVSAYPTVSTNGETILQLMDGGATQIAMWHQDETGSIVLKRGSTDIATVLTNIQPNIYYYIEIDVLISNAIGVNEFKVWVNGAEVYSAEAGTDTQATGNAYVNRIRFGPTVGSIAGSESMFIDDVYVLNSDGTDPDEHLGDVQVDILYPDSDFAAGFDRSSGSDNYALVDETTPDGDTSYVFSDTVGVSDLYGLTSLASISDSDIIGIQIVFDAKKTSGAERILTTLVRDPNDTTVYDHTSDPSLALTEDYQTHVDTWPRRPSDDGAWTEADIADLKVGVKIVG